MSESRLDRTYERVCCRNGECRALLMKATASCLREGGAIEIKCGKCNTMNYLLGRPALTGSGSQVGGVTT